MTITRRHALTGIAALPVLAAVPAVAEGNPDAELIAKAERFVELYEEEKRIEAGYKAMRARVEAHPDCPSGDVAPADDRQGWEAWWNFLGNRGVWVESDRWNKAFCATEDAARDLFQTPARTPAGILIKLRVLRMGLGAYSKAEDENDANLLYAQFGRYSEEDENGNQEKLAPDIDFLSLVLTDLERMTGANVVAFPS